MQQLSSFTRQKADILNPQNLLKADNKEKQSKKHIKTEETIKYAPVHWSAWLGRVEAVMQPLSRS